MGGWNGVIGRFWRGEGQQWCQDHQHSDIRYPVFQFLSNYLQVLQRYLTPGLSDTCISPIGTVDGNVTFRRAITDASAHLASNIPVGE